MYTLEQLNTIGFKIQFPNINVIWTTSLYSKTVNDGLFGHWNNLEIKAPIIKYDNKQYIQFEKADYTGNYYYMISLSELKRIGMLKDIEKPKTFAITGKEHHLKAMWEDLKELGYIFSNLPEKGMDCIINDIIFFQNKNHFIKLYSGTKNHGWKDINQRHYGLYFKLPEDYLKALEYAKEAINSPYWDSFKEKIVKIGNKDVKITSKGEIIGTKNYTIHNWETLKSDLINIVLFNKERDSYYAITINSFSIGCEKNVTLEQVETLINTYYELNPK